MRQSAAKPQQNTCIHCKDTKPLERFVKDKKTKLGVRNVCLDCSLLHSKSKPDYKKKRNERVARFRKTFRGGISQRMMACKQRAVQQKLPFDIDMLFLIELWEEQEGKCALSGRPIHIGNSDWWSRASIDKIEPDKGYVKGNVQFLSMQVNYAKNNMNNEEFIKLCKDIVEEGSTTIPKGSTPKRVEAPDTLTSDDIV